MSGEYGFPGLFDAFDSLAERLGPAVVGQPLHSARYIGEHIAYQMCEGGMFTAVKLDDGSWRAQFYATRGA